MKPESQEQVLFIYCKNCEDQTEHTISGYFDNNLLCKCLDCGFECSYWRTER